MTGCADHTLSQGIAHYTKGMDTWRFEVPLLCNAYTRCFVLLIFGIFYVMCFSLSVKGTHFSWVKCHVDTYIIWLNIPPCRLRVTWHQCEVFPQPLSERGKMNVCLYSERPVCTISTATCMWACIIQQLCEKSQIRFAVEGYRRKKTRDIRNECLGVKSIHRFLLILLTRTYRKTDTFKPKAYFHQQKSLWNTQNLGHSLLP